MQQSFVVIQVLGLKEGLKHPIFIQAFTREELEDPLASQMTRVIILALIMSDIDGFSIGELANAYVDITYCTDYG